MRLHKNLSSGHQHFHLAFSENRRRVSRGRQCVCGGATVLRTRLTLSQAGLWWGLGWPVSMGSAYPQPCAGDPQESLLCRDVCFRSLPVSGADQRPGRSSETDAGGGDARLAGPFAGASRRIHHGGRGPEEQRTLGKEPLQWRRDNTERASTRRLGTAARAVVVRSLWPGTDRELPGQRWHLSHVSVQLVASPSARHQGLPELPL